MCWFYMGNWALPKQLQTPPPSVKRANVRKNCSKPSWQAFCPYMEATHFKKGLPQYQSCSRRNLGCMALTETICKSTTFLFLVDTKKDLRSHSPEKDRLPRCHLDIQSRCKHLSLESSLHSVLGFLKRWRCCFRISICFFFICGFVDLLFCQFLQKTCHCREQKQEGNAGLHLAGCQ